MKDTQKVKAINIDQLLSCYSCNLKALLSQVSLALAGGRES